MSLLLEREEPDEPPPRLTNRSKSPSLPSGEIVSNEDDIPDIQSASDLESEDDMEDMHLDSMPKENVTEVEPSFKDSADAEVETLRHDPEVIQDASDDVDLEDFQTKSIVTHIFEQGHLHFLAELETGEFLSISFHEVKKDHPVIVSQCTMDNDVGRTQKKWAQGILK